MKKILALFFTLSISTAPVFAWGFGSDCPYSKDKVNQEKSEQVEESDN